MNGPENAPALNRMLFKEKFDQLLLVRLNDQQEAAHTNGHNALLAFERTIEPVSKEEYETLKTTIGGTQTNFGLLCARRDKTCRVRDIEGEAAVATLFGQTSFNTRQQPRRAIDFLKEENPIEDRSFDLHILSITTQEGRHIRASVYYSESGASTNANTMLIYDPTEKSLIFTSYDGPNLSVVKFKDGAVKKLRQGEQILMDAHKEMLLAFSAARTS